MSGFTLPTRDCTPSPVDAKQLYYLITESYLAIPSLDEREIADKNNAGSLLHIFNESQILWFIINSSARAALCIHGYSAILKRLALEGSKDIRLRTMSRSHLHKHAHGLVKAMKTVVMSYTIQLPRILS